MQSIINLAVTVTFLLSLQFGLPRLYHYVKVQTLTKIAKGLPDLSPIARNLTGKK